MARELSREAEQHLASVAANEFFSSKEAALEPAAGMLRSQFEQIPAVPAEHMELLEQGLASIETGCARASADAAWEVLRRHARGAALRKAPCGISRA